jgi:hypothetical protein
MVFCCGAEEFGRVGQGRLLLAAMTLSVVRDFETGGILI